MRFTSRTTSDGVSENLFIIGDISGVLWTAVGATGPKPLILMGHGGGQHKKAPGVLARAYRFATGCEFDVAAIDAPGHGDRPRTADDERHSADLRRRMAAGEPIGAQIARYNAEVAALAVPEWRSTLDALCETGFAAGPVGYWGISMGSAIGVQLVAAETRIRAAVLGLTGHELLSESAARITVPVEFLMQWDDEIVARDSALALFSAFGSAEKSLHANSGRHAEVPRFEIESAELFYQRHLVAGPPLV